VALTTGEAIDYGGKFYLSAGSDTVTTRQPIRDRARFFLTELGQQAWTEAFWEWKLNSASIPTVALQNYVVAPGDFSGFAPETQIYVAGRQWPLKPADIDIIDGLRETTPRNQIPEIYALRGSSYATPLVQLYPTPNTVYTLDFTNYRRRAPDMVDRPGAPTVADGGGGGVLSAGNYQWLVTFSTLLGETEAGVASTVQTLAVNHQGSLTAIPTSPVHRVVNRKIYRTAAGGVTYGLVGTINDNVTTTFTDNVSDANLGAAPPTTSTAVTGMEQWPEEFHEPIFVGGLIHKLATSLGDARDTDWQTLWLRTVKKLWAEFRTGQNSPQAMAPYGSMAGPIRTVSWRFRIPT
jgi:hypothetical protein